MNPVWTNDISELNSFEKIKLDKDGLDILDDLPEYTRLRFESIPQR